MKPQLPLGVRRLVACEGAVWLSTDAAFTEADLKLFEANDEKPVTTVPPVGDRSRIDLISGHDIEQSQIVSRIGQIPFLSINSLPDWTVPKGTTLTLRIDSALPRCSMSRTAIALPNLAAEKTDNNYAIKIEFDDAPTGGTPSERYFIAIIGGASEQLDTANNVMKLNLSLWINSNVVRVNAAA